MAQSGMLKSELKASSFDFNFIVVDSKLSNIQNEEL